MHFYTVLTPVVDEIIHCMLSHIWYLHNQKMVIREERCKAASVTCNNAMVLLTLLIILSRRSWKFNLVSRWISRCFWDGNYWTRLWLKYIKSWFLILTFAKNLTSWASPPWSGLKPISHCIAQSMIFPAQPLRSLLKLFGNVLTWWTTQKGKRHRQIA